MKEGRCYKAEHARISTLCANTSKSEMLEPEEELEIDRAFHISSTENFFYSSINLFLISDF